MNLPRGPLRILTGIFLHFSLMTMLLGCTTLRTDESLVQEEIAFQHAAVAMVEHVLIPSPTPVDSEVSGQGWESARIGEAVLFHDINGQPLLYSYPVVSTDETVIGHIWIAANKSLGSTLVLVNEGREFVRFEAQIQKARAIVQSRHPDWEIESIVPVVYNYPRFGFMITMRALATSERSELILDYYTFSEATRAPLLERKHISDNTEINFSTSFFDALPPEQKNERIHQWESHHTWSVRLSEEIGQYGKFPMALRTKPLMHVVDLFAVSNSLYAQLQCKIYMTRNPWHEYCQSGVPFCAAAVGRNIAGYYGLSHSEAKVAKLMSITYKVWPTVQGELTYYKSPQGLNKAGTVNYNTGTLQGTSYLNDWRSIKNELWRDKDYFIPSTIGLGSHGSPGPSGWKEPGHWNALYGMKVCKTQQGTESVKLIVHDPWPPNTCTSKSHSFAAMKGYLRSHTIPKDPGPPPTWPSKPNFEPWKCKQKKYKLLYEGSCKKWEDLLKNIGTHIKKELP